MDRRQNAMVTKVTVTLVIPAAFVTKQIFNKFLGFVLFYLMELKKEKKKQLPKKFQITVMMPTLPSEQCIWCFFCSQHAGDI